MAQQSKDRQIASQSTLKLVQEWASNNNYKMTLKDIMSISVVLVDYVENGYSKELAERMDKVDKYIETQYKG